MPLGQGLFVCFLQLVVVPGDRGPGPQLLEILLRLAAPLLLRNPVADVLTAFVERLHLRFSTRFEREELVPALGRG